MKNPNLGRFEVGDRVVVKGEFRTGYTGGTKKIPIEISYKCPRFGIISGATYKCLGEYKPGVTIEWDIEPPYLSVEKKVLVWQVKLGLLNKPLLCLSEQLERNFIFPNFKIPIRHYFKHL